MSLAKSGYCSALNFPFCACCFIGHHSVSVQTLGMQPCRLLSWLTLGRSQGLPEWPELERLFPQFRCLPFWVLAAAAQPSSMPWPLSPMYCKGQSQKPIHKGTAQTWGWWVSPHEAPCLQPSRQVLWGVSVQLKAGKPPSFLPPSHPTPRPGSAAGTHPFPSY